MKFARTKAALERYDRFFAVWDKMFDHMRDTNRFRQLVRRERFFAWKTVGLAFLEDSRGTNSEDHVRTLFACHGHVTPVHARHNEFDFGFDNFIRKCIEGDK